MSGAREPLENVLYSRRWLLISLFICAGVVVIVGFRSFMSTLAGSTAGPTSAPHMNHRPQHGGMFFMSLDNVHHLEGVLVTTGTFQVYVYDAFTRTLPPDEMEEASGVVEVGETANPPKFTLEHSKDEKTLQTKIDKDEGFPITLTLYLHLPGSAPDAKPEVFTFHFNRYSSDTN
jgi:hypothetical protein